MVFSFSENERQTKNNKSFLITVIALLSAVVIGLGAAIAVVIINNNSGTGGDSGEEEAVEEMNNIYDRMNEVENWKGYIDGKISEYEGTEQEVQLRLMKVSQLLVEEGPTSATAEIEKMNPEEMNDLDKMRYYFTMNQIKVTEKRDDEADYYKKMYDELWDKYYGKDGYGG